VGADGVEKIQAAEGVKVSRDADGFDRVVFSIEPKGMPEGEYTIRVSIGANHSLASSLRIH
jgi:hypothetical protein